jgi:hypothetical protein
MKISVEERHIDCGGQNVGGSWLGASQGRRAAQNTQRHFWDKSGVWESLRDCRASPSNPGKAWLTTLRSSLTMVSVSEG